MQFSSARWLVAGVVLGAIGTAAAVSPAEMIKGRKAPSSKEAFALPLLERPPARCDAEHAGWMYFDVDMRQGGAEGCICVQDKDSTFHWAAFGGQGVTLGSGQRECE